VTSTELFRLTDRVAVVTVPAARMAPFFLRSQQSSAYSKPKANTGLQTHLLANSTKQGKTEAIWTNKHKGRSPNADALFRTPRNLAIESLTNLKTAGPRGSCGIDPTPSAT
jgi:hypothetical protein